MGMALFLVLGAIGVNAAFSSNNGASGSRFGVSLVSSAYGAQSLRSVNDLTIAETAGSGDVSSLATSQDGVGETNYLAQEEGAVFDGSAGSVKDPGGTFVDSTSQSGVISYTVRSGDTLPSIAAYFGITVDTITNANPSLNGDAVTPGQVLKILPVSGVIYKTRSGDTLPSIADAFGVSEAQIVQANPTVDLSAAAGPSLVFVDPGISLIIPQGK